MSDAVSLLIAEYERHKEWRDVWADRVKQRRELLERASREHSRVAGEVVDLARAIAVLGGSVQLGLQESDEQDDSSARQTPGAER